MERYARPALIFSSAILMSTSGLVRMAAVPRFTLAPKGEGRFAAAVSNCGLAGTTKACISAKKWAAGALSVTRALHIPATDTRCCTAIAEKNHRFVLANLYRVLRLCDIAGPCRVWREN